MKYIWESNSWPEFIYDKRKFEPKLQSIAILLSELKGMRVSFTQEEKELTQVYELGVEVENSYAIEGESIKLEEITDSIALSMHYRDMKSLENKYQNISNMVLDATDTSKPLNKERLFMWHRLMFEGQSSQNIGNWRKGKMQIISGKVSDIKVEYVAPPADIIETDMSRFFSWIQKNIEISPVVKSAIAHLWFESIHPFDDGNGRIGRAISEYILRMNPNFKDIPFSLSRGILEKRKEYYQQFKKVQLIENTSGPLDITEFILWFIEIVNGGIEYARSHALYIIAKNRFFKEKGDLLNERQKLVLEKIILQGKERIDLGISAKTYMKIAKTSSASATRDLLDLVNKKVLSKSEDGGRSTRYFIINLLTHS